MIRRVTFPFYVARGPDDDEIELTVTASVSPLVRGRIHGPPDDCYPDEVGEVEIESLTIGANGPAWDGELTEDEADGVRAEALEYVDFDDCPEPDALWDLRGEP